MQQPQVARFEAGGTIPKIATLQRLVTALDGHIFLSFSGSDRPRRSSAVVKRAAPAIGQRAAGAKRSASSAKKVTAKRGAQVKA